MRKTYLVIVLCFCSVLASCQASPNDENEAERFTEIVMQNEVSGVTTDIYAIYASSIVESSALEIGEYAHREKDIQIRFPQIYFSNEYAEYSELIETDINNLLFNMSIRNDDSIVLERDNRNIWEYRSDYTITMANEELLSVQFYGHIYTVWRAMNFCYGITIDIKTGEVAEISDYIAIDESLIEGVRSGATKIHSPGYEQNFIIEMVSSFINSYDTLPSIDNSYFISENTVYLIVPVSFGNSNYFILEMEYRA